MALLQIQPLTASLLESRSYPENLCNKTTYIDALKNYRYRLDEVENGLCVLTDEHVNVPFRDLVGDGPGTDTPDGMMLYANSRTEFERHKVYDDDSLQTRLGEASKLHPNPASLRPEPKCRFM